MGQILLPEKGIPREDVLNTLKSFKSDDVKWHDGQLFGLIYETGIDVEDLVKEASALFLIENGLNPAAFPSLVKMETEVVSMVTALSAGDDEAVGNLTSGGTESIFMALKAARDWAGGVYATPCLAGGRPGGNIAAAWAVFHYLGEEGFLALAKKAGEATAILVEGINSIPQLYVLGSPDATVFAFASNQINIYELAVKMAARGWHIEAQQLPPSLHMTISPVHLAVADKFLDDLRGVIPEVPRADTRDLSEQTAMYAMLNTMPDRSMAREFAVEYINNLYRVS